MQRFPLQGRIKLNNGSSPLSFRWTRPKHSVALSDVFVCPPTFALGPSSQLCNVFAFPGFYQWCCRSCLSLHLSEMSLAHILERSSVGICLLRVRLVLLLWNSQRILLLCCLSISCLRGNLYYTCLSIVGLRVVHQVATLDSCEKISSFLRASPSPVTSHFMLFYFSSSSSSCTCSSFSNVLT